MSGNQPANMMTDGYDGPGLTMLSNPRFHELVDRSKGLLHLRLVLRSPGRVKVRNAEECNFLLSLANPYNIGRSV